MSVDDCERCHVKGEEHENIYYVTKICCKITLISIKILRLESIKGIFGCFVRGGFDYESIEQFFCPFDVMFLFSEWVQILRIFRVQGKRYIDCANPSSFTLQ